VHGMQRMAAENDLTAWLQTQPAIAENVAHMSSFQCTECDRTFESLTSLCTHVRLHIIRVPNYLSQCTETVQALHNSPHQCTVCDRRFVTKSDLAAHIANNPEAHECAVCGRRIENAFYLRVHQLVHRDRGGQPVQKRAREPRPCPICFRVMTSASSLHEHIRSVHSPTKKFVCHVCAKQCAQRSQLTRHMLTHGGERRYECGKCGRRFLTHDLMNRHMRVVHARYRPYLCSLCGRSFGAKHHLIAHMKVHQT
jgi:KRAB domain-containing zinc finger protein